MRIPLRISGSAAGTTISRRRARRVAPRLWADQIRVRSTPLAPLNELRTTGSRHPRKITAILQRCPMPSQIMRMGISADFGRG